MSAHASVAHRARLTTLLAGAAALALACTPPPPPATTSAPVVAARDTAPAAARDTTPPWPRGTLREGRFWSQSLGVTKRYLVWLPPAYERDAAARYPVVYELHGLFGAETDWTRKAGLDRSLDSLVAAGMPPAIVVMPDGDDGWWTTSNRLPDVAACRRAERNEPADTYCVPWPHYDDYVARDLVAHVDSTYRTVARRGGRALAGLSMGGYGAVALALAYPEVFGAAASHSGVVSPLYAGPAPFVAPPRYFASADSLRARWKPFWASMGPAFGSDTAGWWARDPARLARRLHDAGTTPPALWLDTGVDDRLARDETRAFAWELTALGIPHELHERPGKHDWAYWRAVAPVALRWMVEGMGR